MQTLVVGYDGTDGAQAALRAATELAEELGDGVVAVFAYSIARLGGEVSDYAKAVEEHGRAMLEDARRIAADAGVEVDTVLRERESAECLIEVADERDARMIVVGSYGERPLKSALVGSTPTRLLHLSDRPVLVVRAPD
jgi:nucleotide-binding universal stress UspA family protein